MLAAAILLTAALAYCYWGLGVTLGPLIAVYFAREAEKKGLPLDFPFLLATTGAANAVWQFGFSASAPLLMNTPGHFLEKTTGLMPLRTTILAPGDAAVRGRVSRRAAGDGAPAPPAAIRGRSPAFPAPGNSPRRHRPGRAERGRPPGPESVSERIESNPLPTAVLAAVLVGWLVYHFAVMSGGLELNSLNTMLLLLCLVFHRNVRNFSRTLPAAVVAAWPVVVLYHLYAGVAGLIQFTTVGDSSPRSSPRSRTTLTFPFLTALSASWCRSSSRRAADSG